MGSILEVKDLFCGYDGKNVIRDVSFCLEEKGFLGIIGPNGAGKTTLLKTIARLIHPSAGKIIYRGRNIFEFKTRDLAREIAVLPQTMEMVFSYSVEEFVSLGRFPHLNRFSRFSAHDREAVKQALVLTEIADLKERKINELSVGEKQRVFIAQGLAQEPNFMILDEPTAHLDIAHQVEILSLLRRLNAEKGLSVLLILHDLNMAAEFCKNLILLNAGKIHSSGTPSEVLTYQNIEEVYRTVVIVKENPLSKKPYVFVVARQEDRECREKV